MPNLPPSTDGRSQHLTCDAVETVLVDRKTLEELSWSLAMALDEIDSIRLQQQFVVVAQYFISKTRNKQGERALLFLDRWFERSPGQLKSVETGLLEARRVFRLILEISKMGDA